MKQAVQTVDYEKRVSQWAADMIGDPSRAEEIEHIIDTSTARRVLLHGIKRATATDGAQEVGILPLTPEGTAKPSSFWASGTRIFANKSNAGKNLTCYDTPFFHYAHVRGSEVGQVSMSLAVTELGSLSDRLNTGSIYGLDNDYVQITEPVPPDAIHFLSVDLQAEVNLSARENAQRAEQELLTKLGSLLSVEASA